MPQCAFTARAGGRRVLVLVNVDDGPAPYFRLPQAVGEGNSDLRDTGPRASARLRA
ncbi:MAG: hypothetical protein KGL15_12130 [Acidobacteriota bacterium]|nr:hypothetical protein [Acidobacteriota bacterium]